MEWKGHVELVATKGTRRLNFVIRVLKGTQRPVKAQWYKTLVRPLLEYRGMVWDRYQIGQVKAIERVQRQAAMRIMGRLGSWRRETFPESTSAMLVELGWENLSERRKKARLCGLHRALIGHEGWAEMGAGLKRKLSQRHGLIERKRCTNRSGQKLLSIPNN
jgi:hypothetical protein